MGDRKAATEFILKYVDKILPGSENKKFLEEILTKMTDKRFEEYMNALESGEEILPLYIPILSKDKINVQRNIAIGKELGHDFFQKIWWYDENTETTYLSNEKYMVIDLPLRRQIQILQKKISIPSDNKHVDELTGQPSGTSASAKISFPEMTALHSQGLDRAIEELIKYRGGDQKGFNAMNRSIVQTGGVSLDALKPYSSTVKSTETLSTFLKAMHLDNNL